MSHSFIGRLTLRLQVLRNQNVGAGSHALDGEAAVDLLGLVRKVAEDNPRPRVVVLVSGEGARTTTSLQSAIRGARILEFDVGLDFSDLPVRLAARGRSDVVVVDETVDGTRHVDLFDRVFGNLRRGGTFVVMGNPEAPARDSPLTQSVAEFLEQHDDVAEQAGRSAAQPDRQRLFTAIETVAQGRDTTSFTSLGRCAAVLTESQTNQLLELAPGRGRVLKVLPETELISSATIRHSPGVDIAAATKRFRAPALSLREYHHVSCLNGQVVVQRNVLLPDTFRHNQKPRLKNRFLQPLGGSYARPRIAKGAERLEGAWFHLDSEFRGHFGHAMTEQLSRLWAWEQAKGLEPSLKALMLNNNRKTLGEHEVLLYEAAGVAREDLVLVPGPVRVDRLFGATPMFSQPAYAHPGLASLWERVGSWLAAHAPEREYANRIFVSRRISKRACHNTADVERFFSERGFTVIYPEDYPLTEQAQIFRQAQAIGGFAGSALFNTLFCDTPRHVLMVSSEAYTAKNEQMIAAVRGHHLDIAWCRPDVRRPPSGWTRESFHSPFTFDPDREGAWLDEVLGATGSISKGR